MKQTFSKNYTKLPRFDRIQYQSNLHTGRYHALPNQDTKSMPLNLKRAKTWRPQFKVPECLETEKNRIFTGLERTIYNNWFIGNIREARPTDGKIIHSLLLIQFGEDYLNIFYFKFYSKYAAPQRQSFAKFTIPILTQIINREGSPHI